MAFVELDDGLTQLEATLFTDTYVKYENLINKDVQIFQIKTNQFRNKKTYVIDHIKPIDK
jgi:DNA polymerase III alpha subunit